MTKTAHKYRLYPTTEQEQTLLRWLEDLRWLYNTALTERRNNWKWNRKNVSHFEQKRNLLPLKQHKPEFDAIYSQVLQDTIRRLDKAFANFFRRVKENRAAGYRRHNKLGYPRYKTNPDRFPASPIRRPPLSGSCQATPMASTANYGSPV